MKTLLAISVVLSTCTIAGSVLSQEPAPLIPLPEPSRKGTATVEETLAHRRSVRAFRQEPITLRDLAQLLWAAQGVSLKEDAPPNWTWGPWQGGRRTAPSAGALYPLEVYVVVGAVEGLAPGVYHYHPGRHQLEKRGVGDQRERLAAAALRQSWMVDAPVIVIVAGVYSRTEAKYGDRAERYVHLEAGHAVENLCLQAVGLGLGTTMVGAFDDDRVKEVTGLREEEQPLAIVPAGKPRP
jgi:SagB-type dehydrogenase family enzyme